MTVLLSVVSLGKMFLTKKQKEDMAKQGNRYLESEFSHNVELLGESNHIAIFKTIEETNGVSLFQGQSVLEQNGLGYILLWPHLLATEVKQLTKKLK